MYLTVSTVTSPGKAHRFAERRRIGCSGFDFGVATRESQDFLGTFIDFTVKEAAVVVVAVKSALTSGLEHRDHFREVGVGRIAGALADAVQAFGGTADGFGDHGAFLFLTAISVGGGQAFADIIDGNALGRNFDAVFTASNFPQSFFVSPEPPVPALQT